MKLPSLERLGKPGVIALGILLCCLSYYLGSISPAETELANTQREIARLASGAAPSGRASAPVAGQPLPPFSSATESLKKLADLASQHGVTIERASYDLVDKEGQRRLQIELPLKTSYLPLRMWLRDVLAQPGAPSLDSLNLQRQQAGDALLNADVRLTYYFAVP